MSCLAGVFLITRLLGIILLFRLITFVIVVVSWEDAVEEVGEVGKRKSIEAVIEFFRTGRKRKQVM